MVPQYGEIESRYSSDNLDPNATSPPNSQRISPSMFQSYPHPWTPSLNHPWPSKWHAKEDWASFTDSCPSNSNATRSKKLKDQVYSWIPIQYASQKTQITKQSKPSWASMESPHSLWSTIKTSRILLVLDMKAKKPSVVFSLNVISMASNSMMKRYHPEWQAYKNWSITKSLIHSIPLLATLTPYFKVVKIYWYRIKLKKYP